MTFLRHVLPTRVVSCVGMSVTRGTKIMELCCGASERVRPREAKMPRLPGNVRLLPNPSYLTTCVEI
jgi:hypothetical protein